MKVKIYPFISTIVIATSLALTAGCTTQSALEAHAKISKTQAQSLALARVPNGTVKSGEIEKEHGKLIWSFDIATPGSNDSTEVNVDALTGDIVAIDHESAADEAKEKADKD